MQTQLAVSNVNLEQWVTTFNSSYLLDSMLLIMAGLLLLATMLAAVCLLSWSYKNASSLMRRVVSKRSNICEK